MVSWGLNPGWVTVHRAVPHCTDLPPLAWNTASDKELVTWPSATPTGTSRVCDLWANRPSRSSAVVLLTPWGLALHVWPEGRGDGPGLARWPARGQGALWTDRHFWNSCLPALTRGRRKASPPPCLSPLGRPCVRQRFQEDCTCPGHAGGAGLLTTAQPLTSQCPAILLVTSHTSSNLTQLLAPQAFQTTKGWLLSKIWPEMD